ncbi:MAG: hypothetical protein R3F37_16115 [Candidatus Competibacteraceae bacterium]
MRIVLRSTLIKDLRDLPLFEELFTVLQFAQGIAPSESTAESQPPRATEPYPLEAAAEQNLASGHADDDHTHEESLDIQDYFDAEDMVAHFNAHQDDHDFRLAEFGQNLLLSRHQELLDQVMQKATQLLKVRRVKNAGRAGELNFSEAVTALDADLIADAMTELLEELNDLDIDEHLVRCLARRLEGGMTNLPELLKRHFERELALQPPRKLPNDRATQRMTTASRKRNAGK